jgi:hypothetical protein
MLPLALILVAPVAGPVERGFDPGRPFEAGRHRGVDFAAAPGTPVRAACSGPVVFAGRIAGDGIVTLRCRRWRVTHMPLATISERGHVRRGAPVGTVAASSEHAGLHLGVRRDGTRFGYADPLRFLAAPGSPVPLGRAPRGTRPVRPPGAGPGPRPPRVAPRAVRPAPRALGPARAARRIVRPPPAASSPLAPWSAWAGLALALAGAGVSFHVRTRIRTRSPARRGGSVTA